MLLQYFFPGRSAFGVDFLRPCFVALFSLVFFLFCGEFEMEDRKESSKGEVVELRKKSRGFIFMVYLKWIHRQL